MHVIESRNAEMTHRLGLALAKVIEPGDWIGLIGELGAGKTHFAQGLLVGLGVTGAVKSPTFSLVHSYEGRLPIHHIDLYRLGGLDDLTTIGYDDLARPENVLVVEWADKLGSWQPPDGLLIRIAVGGENYRVLRLVPLGERGRQLVEAMSSVEGDA